MEYDTLKHCLDGSWLAVGFGPELKRLDYDPESGREIYIISITLPIGDMNLHLGQNDPKQLGEEVV